MALNDDLYAVMGVSPGASASEIDRAYKSRIVKCHPDLAKDPTDAARRTQAAARLNAAATVLRDPTRRAVYDFDRVVKARAASSSTPTSTPSPSGQTYRPTPAPSYAARRPAAFVPPEEDDFSDIFDYVPSARRHHSIRQPRQWLLYDRIGQWVAFIAIVLLAAGASSMFVPSGDAPRFVAAVGGVWLLFVAILTQSIENPAGDIFRLVAHFGEWTIRAFVAAGRASSR